MKLTDNNIDSKTAKYWCFLSDKTLKNALKEVVKNTNSQKALINEFVLPIAAVAATAGAKWVASTAASIALYYGIDWLMSDKTKDSLQSLDSFGKIYNTNKVLISNADMQALASSLNYSDTKNILSSLWKLDQPDTYRDWRMKRVSHWIGDDTYEQEWYTVDNRNKRKDALEYLSNRFDDNQIALVMLLYKSSKYNKNTTYMSAEGQYIDPFDEQLKQVEKIRLGIQRGDISLKLENGAPTLIALNENGVTTLAKNSYNWDSIKNNQDLLKTSEEKPEEKDSKEKPEEKKSEEKKSEENKHEEKKPEENKQEQAAEQSVSDSPDIQQNSNAVAWIAAAAAAAVAVPYLWKRLKQLADYIKSGKTFAKCQFRCTENDQEYVFEYDLNQLQWKLKFAGSTALKYTPYPSDDEVNSFVQTKFAKNFVDEVESQLKSLYSAKDKKLLFKAVQAAGKDGSDLIKYLFDNQKSIENSLYGIKKHKLWESIIKKYKIWESARLQRHRRKLI